MAPARVLPILITLVALTGCGNDDGRTGDVDAGPRTDAATPDAGARLAEPALPSFLPCPPGWREIDVAGFVACDPWPETGRVECGAGEAHFPGEPGCRAVGSSCPSGEWPDDLPDDARVRFVREGAIGGTGTRAAPFGTLAQALTAASAGDVVALSRGTFEGGAQLARAVTIRGACASETEIRVSAAGPMAALSIVVPNVVLRDVRLSGAAWGLFVTTADPLTLEGVVIAVATGVGIAIGEGSRLVGRDVVIRDTQPDGGGRLGFGLLARYGSVVEIERAVLARNRMGAVSVDDPDTSVRLTDVALSDTLEQDASRSFGRGAGLQNGGQLTLERAAVEGNAEIGLVAADLGSSMTLRDVVVRDTLGQSDGWFGRGIGVGRSASATLERVRIEASHETGLHLIAGARAVVADVLVVATEPRVLDQLFGGGIAVLDAALEGTRLAIVDNTGVGVSAEGASATITATDLVVVDTRASEAPFAGWFGRGINLQDSAFARIERALIHRNRDVGVFLSDAARAELLDVRVSDTAERACAETTCAGLGAGLGVGSYGGHADLRRFVVTNSALAGIQIARGGSVDLHEGEVTHNAFGVNLQVPGYDVARLMDRVLYRDNDVNLDSTELPVPEPVGSL